MSMARSSLLLLLFLLASMAPTLKSRNLPRPFNKISHDSKISLHEFRFDTLFFTALPKGTTPPSSPTKRGHATLTDGDQMLLRARHLIAADHQYYYNRILRSVPSPGVGH